MSIVESLLGVVGEGTKPQRASAKSAPVDCPKSMSCVHKRQLKPNTDWHYVAPAQTEHILEAGSKRIRLWARCLCTWLAFVWRDLFGSLLRVQLGGTKQNRSMCRTSALELHVAGRTRCTLATVDWGQPFAICNYLLYFLRQFGKLNTKYKLSINRLIFIHSPLLSNSVGKSHCAWKSNWKSLCPLPRGLPRLLSRGVQITLIAPPVHTRTRLDPPSTSTYV